MMSPEDQAREIAKLDYEMSKADVADRVKFQTEFAHSVLRGLTLGNGGAIVALFTFIGNNDGTPGYDASLIWWAFAAFLIGLFATFSTAFAAFFSQGFYMRSSASEGWTSQSQMFGGNETWDHKADYRRGEFAERIGIGAAFLGLLSFAVGSAFALAGVIP